MPVRAKRRFCIIFNPTAGSRRVRRLQSVVRLLVRRGGEVVLKETEGRGDAERIARESLDEGFDVIVAAGGDGTINEVLNGLAGGTAVLGVIPLGTANVLAAELGLPTRPAALARLLARAEPQPIYPGLVGDRRFATMAGVGFDARVVASVDLGLKRRVGKLAYVWRGLIELWCGSALELEVRCEAATHRASGVIVAKGRHYAGRFVSAPDADLAEPLLHACLLTRGGRWPLLRTALLLPFRPVARMPDVTLVRGRSFTIAAPEGAPVQADGDVAGTVPVTVAVASDPVKVIAPPR